MATWKQRLTKLEPLAMLVAFLRALRKARQVAQELFWDTLWAWAPGDATHKWLDFALLTEAEVALVAGPGFATYANTLDDYTLQTLAVGGAALMTEMGMETFEQWCRRQSPETQG